MRTIAKRALGLLKRSWKTMFLFEIIFRLLSMYAVFPVCKWLFNSALRVTGLNCLTADNWLRVLMNPLMLLCFMLLFLIFSLTSMLEISCLITCLNDASEPECTLNVLQVLREGARDSLRMLRPRNLPLLVLTALLIPITYMPSNASPLRLINIPWRTLGKYMLRFPFILVPIVYLLLAALFSGLFMCAYQRCVLEDLPAVAALRGAFRLNRNRRLARLGQFLLWIVAVGGGLLLLVRALDVGLSRLISLIVPNLTLRYHILLPLSTVMNFLRGSLPAMACYPFLNAVYLISMAEMGETLPPRRVAPHRDARRFNALLFYLVVLLCAVGLALYDTQLRPLLARMNALEYVPGHPTMIISHRGYFRDADENTLAAFQAAIELGVDYVERDVQQTADDVVIVNHDISFKRVYGVNRRTWEVTYDELRGFSAPVTGEYPPTLREVLTLCDPQANFLIELKDNGHNPNLARAVYDILIETGRMEHCAIQSSTYRLIREFKDLSPETRCGYILSFALGSYAPLSAADFFSLDYNFVNERVIDDVHRVDKDLYVWTLNNESEISTMVELGADGVITDDVPLAKNLLLESSAAAPLDELIAEPLEELIVDPLEGALAPEETVQPAETALESP